ncbi:MAG: EboA domain-containing protein [Burkholderiales bacterium]|nr:EboA domain-containing protein [Burkholderiales bacterium]
MRPLEVLDAWLHARLSAPALTWLQEQAARLAGDDGDAALFMAVSLVAHRIGKDDLIATVAEREAAERARSGWDPTDWSLDQAARIYLLLATAGDSARFARRLDQLCATADVSELVAFYRGLPLYPDPPRHAVRAAEGVRSNMKAVLQAVAHRNPYPAEYLPDGAWNQMVLKAIFVGLRLDPIVGLDRRANPVLARMLADYAHERWAASRPISPELWRCVGPFADAGMLEDLARVLRSGSTHERAAAALSLTACGDARAGALLDAHPDLARAIAAGTLTWRTLAQAI